MAECSSCQGVKHDGHAAQVLLLLFTNQADHL